MQSRRTTSLSYTEELFEDFRGNKAANDVLETSAVEVDELVYDTTDPRLISFTIDMDLGKIMLTFDEVIRANEVDMSAFTLQHAAQATTSQSHALGNEGSVSDVNDVEVTITMAVPDLNSIKGHNMANLEDGTDTYIVVGANGAKDMVLPTGRSLTAIENGVGQLRATKLIKDQTAPKLDSFVLDMNTGVLTMSFTETVVGSNFDSKHVTFHSTSGEQGSGSSLTLKKGTPSQESSTVVTLQLDIDDLNAIKANPDLLVSRDTTFLTMEPSAVQDVSGNQVEEVETRMPLPVKSDSVPTPFTADVTDAELESFTLDMNGAGRLSLTFKESVNPAKLLVHQITLQSTKLGGTSVTLNSETSIPTDTPLGVTVAFTLHENDMIQLKLEDVCTTELNTFISMTSTVIEDMVGNSAKAIDADDAMPVRKIDNGFKPDITPPTLTSFVLDVNTAKMTLTISEPVADGSVDITKLTLASKDGTKTFALTSDSSSAELATDNMHVVVSIGAADLNQIKADTALVVSDESSVVVFTSGLLTDRSAAGVGITPLQHSDGMIPSTFQEDDQPPTVASYSYDASTGDLKVKWSEAIDTSNAVKTAFTLFASKEGGTTGTTGQLTLSDQGVITIDPDDNTIMVFTIDPSDRNSVQKDTTLCTTVDNCFLKVDGGAVLDMRGLYSTQVTADDAAPPANFYEDKADPELESFILNMDDNTLSLTFSETMKKTKFKDTTLAIMKKSDPSSAGVVITAGGSVTDVSTDSHIIILTLSDDNANAIKADIGLATDPNGGDAFLLYTTETAEDMSENSLKALTPTGTGDQAASVILDATAPVLDSATLNMNEGTLTLVFNEAVDISSMQQDKISFQGVYSNPGTNTVPLSATTQWTAINLVTVEITLDPIDLNALKKHDSIATKLDGSDTFITVAAGTIRDMNQLAIDGVPDNAAFGVTRFTPDATKPKLEKYEIDLSAGTIKLKFSETVDVESLKANQFTVQSCAD